MTNEQALPISGWYADPENPRELRYWDGAAWAQKWEMPTSHGRPPGRAVVALSVGISVGLFVTTLVLIGRVALNVWGWSMIDNASSSGDVATLDNLDSALAIAFVLTMLGTGIVWMVWQYRLAQASPYAGLRRSPAMHAWSWVIPFFSLWGPYQNIEDLWRHAFPGRTSTYLRCWWAAWLTLGIGTNVARLIAGNVASDAGSKVYLAVGIVVWLFGIGAAVMALHVVRTLTDASLATRAPLDLRGSSAV
ncbi:MAG: hypothetical protein JWQ32_3409 [Marmoricola sp.]|nr:hypothetical protein [Marmoricola sp.]